MSARPVKILHLIDTAGPGGAETVFLELVCRMGPPRWRSVAVVPKEDWLAEALRTRGCEPMILSGRRSFDGRYLARLRGLIREHGVDLVQTHLLSSGVYGTLAAWGRGLPVVSTFHGLPDVPREDPLRGLKLRILSGRMNRTVFVSRSLREGLDWGEGRSESRWEVIPNGIDCEEFRVGHRDDLRRELGLEPDALLLGALGNVRESKRYDILLKAFARARLRLPKAHLAVVGQARGPRFQELLRLRSLLALERCVHFLGFREDVPQILQGIDLFVLSSSDEGFSLATVQAMATGLPVVATRCGGPEEILTDGLHGRLVEPNDPEALARGIVEVATLPDRGLEYGLVARAQVVAQFSVEAMARRYEDLYRRVLLASGRGGGG